MKQSVIELSPAQQAGFDALIRAWDVGHVFGFWGAPGTGRTTVVARLAKELKAGVIDFAEYLRALEGLHPLQMDEAFYRLVLDTLKKHDTVIIDDAVVLDGITGSHCGSYPRAGLIDGVYAAIAGFVEGAAKKLVLVGDHPPRSIYQRIWSYGIEQFKAGDYDFFLRKTLEPDQKIGRAHV